MSEQQSQYFPIPMGNPIPAQPVGNITQLTETPAPAASPMMSQIMQMRQQRQAAQGAATVTKAFQFGEGPTGTQMEFTIRTDFAQDANAYYESITGTKDTAPIEFMAIDGKPVRITNETLLQNIRFLSKVLLPGQSVMEVALLADTLGGPAFMDVAAWAITANGLAPAQVEAEQEQAKNA